MNRLWNPSADDGPSEDVVEISLTHQPTAVLDIGCGTGRNLAPFDRAGISLYGIDSASESVEACRRRFSTHAADTVSIIHADIREYTPHRQFDLILCYGVLHFLDRAARFDAYQQIRRWTAPAGVVSIVMFDVTTPIPDDLRELMPDPAADSAELPTAFSDWHRIRHVHYTYEDEHEGGKIRHQHSIGRLIARKPT